MLFLRKFFNMINLLEKCIDKIFAIIPRKKPNNTILQNAKVIAHRGAHNNFIKENTIKAFDRAVASKCYGIEFDIQVTQDHEIVINHDPTLKRLWEKDLSISNITFTNLRKQLPEIPTLNEIVEKYGKKTKLFIEIKSPFNCYEKLKQILTPLAPIDDYYIISLDKDVLLAAEKYFPTKALFPVATQKNFKEFYNLTLEKKYAGWLGHYLFITKKQIKHLHNNNQIAGVGFIQSENSLYRELNKGINYIFTDDVVKIQKIIRSHE